MMPTAQHTVARPGEETPQYLIFSLGREEYGIEIMHVQEIKGLAPVTPVPNAPRHIRGVLNLRGTIIPIVDLRLRLGMAERPYDRFTVIIVLAVGEKKLGLIVDRVSDVLNIPPEQVDDSPQLSTELDASWFRGVGKPDNRLVFFLDITRLTDLPELDRIPQ